MRPLYSAVSVSKVIPLLLFLFSAKAVLGQPQCLAQQWIQLSPLLSPIGRQHHAMAYDSNRGRTVLFGGIDSITFFGTNAFLGTNVVLGDTWEFDGGTWQQKFPAHSPSARSGHTMTYDVGRGVTLLFGGLNQRGLANVLNDVWEWNGSDWSLVTTTGASPAPRVGHGMAYDSARGVHVMYGGASSAGALGDTWEYDGAGRTWTLRTPLIAGPNPRYWFQLAFDAARNRTLLFGGTPDATVQFADTWVGQVLK